MRQINKIWTTSNNLLIFHDLQSQSLYQSINKNAVLFGTTIVDGILLEADFSSVRFNFMIKKHLQFSATQSIIRHALNSLISS